MIWVIFVAAFLGSFLGSILAVWIVLLLDKLISWFSH